MFLFGEGDKGGEVCHLGYAKIIPIATLLDTVNTELLNFSCFPRNGIRRET